VNVAIPRQMSRSNCSIPGAVRVRSRESPCSQHPGWKTREPFESLLKGDVAASGERGVLAIMGVTHAGMTTDEFSAQVTDWIAAAKHPTGRLFTDMVYQPMLEVLRSPCSASCASPRRGSRR